MKRCVNSSLLSQSGILKQSSHPMSLALLYLFRSAAIAVYVLCGLCELCSICAK